MFIVSKYDHILSSIYTAQYNEEIFCSSSVGVGFKRCEKCLKKVANFGLPSEDVRRWCGGCAKAYPEATNIVRKKSISFPIVIAAALPWLYFCTSVVWGLCR